MKITETSPSTTPRGNQVMRGDEGGPRATPVAAQETRHIEAPPSVLPTLPPIVEAMACLESSAVAVGEELARLTNSNDVLGRQMKTVVRHQ